MEILDKLKSALERMPGPTPSFSLVHAVLMLLVLENESVGRKRLSSMVDIGEGSTRSLIKRLREIGLVNADRSGCFLTERGKEAVRKIRRVMVGPEKLRLSMISDEAYVMLIRGLRSKINVLEMRDEAVRVGGRGAIILVRSGNAILFPETGEPLSKYHPEDEEVIMGLSPLEGDIIVIGIGNDLKGSRTASIAASLKALEYAHG